MKNRFFLFSCLVVWPLLADAQDLTFIEGSGSQGSDGRAADHYFSEESFSAGYESDLGVQRIVRVFPRGYEVTFSLDSQIYFTSNIFLVDNIVGDEGKAAIIANAINAEIEFGRRVAFSGLSSFSVSAHYKRHNYDAMGEEIDLSWLDFDLQSIRASYQLTRQSGLSLEGYLNYNRLYNFQEGYETFQAFIFGFGLRQRIGLKSFGFVMLEADASYSLAERRTSTFDALGEDSETKGSLLLGLRHYKYFWKRFYLNVFSNARFQYFPNWDESRVDLMFTGGIHSGIFVGDWGRLNFYSVIEFKNTFTSSVIRYPDYNKYDIGMGLTLQKQF